MGNSFLTASVNNVFATIQPVLQDALGAVNKLRFDDTVLLFGKARAVITQTLDEPEDDENLLRDLFALNKYIDFFETYSTLWMQILAKEYGASWGTLQDALDQLRLIKKFSELDVKFFENQLLELEAAYPYKVFASIGAIVSRFDCSICGQDIDGNECSHRRGELYRGKLAHGIARGITSLDHVSLVLAPKDKRCVIVLEDCSPQFNVIGCIRNLVAEKSMQIAAFDHLEWSVRRIPNPDYIRLGRNERWFCGSGKKFKRCCESFATVEQDHVDIIPARRDICGPVV